MSTSSQSAQGKPQSRLPWQGQRGEGGNFFGGLRRRFIQIFWCLLLLCALLLFVWLIWLLLLAPKRTQLVVLSAAPYSWPLPPNAWAAEDFDRLKAIDGETITLRGMEDPVFSGTDFLARLDQEIKRSEQQSAETPLVVWVSLHGVADISGDAIHLIPPKASPDDPESWINFDDLLKQFEQLGSERNALLILDCNRMQVNWNVGLLANRFAEKVKVEYRQRIDAGRLPKKFAVLLSAGAEEKSLDSADLRGSVFGHYLQLGLAGTADQMANAGNEDGWVDVSELHHYVHGQVSWWAKQSRGESQRPILLTAEQATDFRLARSLNGEVLASLVKQQSNIKRALPTIPPWKLDLLWKSLDQFREQHLYQREPIAFRDLEHDLLSLEQLSTGGSGYQTQALRVLEDVQGQVQAIESRVARLQEQPTFGAACSLISGNKTQLPRSLTVHTLPLAEYFGSQDHTSSLELRGRFGDLRNGPGAAMLLKTLADFEKRSASEFASTQFMRMLQRYQTPRLWQASDSVGRLLGLQEKIQDFAVPRDAAKLPSDARVHHWSRSLLADVDAARRDAEDAAFLIQDSGLDGKLDVTKERLSQSYAAAAVAETAMQICDRAMAETPYFAQWVAHPLRAVNPIETKETVDNQILPLISNALALSTRLATIPAEANGLQATINQVDAVNAFASGEVAERHESLQGEWRERQKQLLVESESNDLETIGEIEAVLSVPLVPWQSRRDLRDALDRLVDRILQEMGDSGDEETAVAGPVSPSYSNGVTSWKQHPLELILQEDDASSGSGSRRITGFLDSIDSKLTERKSESTVSGQRVICGEAARRMRAAAPIWFRELRQDPIAELRQVDMQSLLIWHAERSVDDFWGPAGRQRSFYDVAATDYCKTVAEMNPWLPAEGTEDDGPLEVRALKTRIEAGRRILPSWLTTTAERTVQLDPVDGAESSFTVTASTGEGFVPPVGTAAVVVRDEKRRVDVTRIQPSDAVVLPTTDARYQVTLPAELAASGSDLAAQTMFRGHEYDGPLNVQQLGGVTIDVVPPTDLRSDVTLNAPWNKLSVAFVLDGSASMKEPLGGGDTEGAVESRIDVAKAALQELLFNLGMRRNVRVGVRAFGHRLGWTVDEPVQPLTRPDFVGSIDPSLTPSQDVESILTLGRFDLAAAQAVIPKIGEVKPWGQSPLYLSVLQSINEFSVGDAEADRHIIVITDGANYQFIPLTVYDAEPTGGNDVLSAWAENPVPVHILGLGMDQSRQPEAVKEFDQVSVATGGHFKALASSTDLKETLRELLAPANYRLSSIENESRPESSANLGTPIEVTPVPKRPEPFWLDYEGRLAETSDSSDQPQQPGASEQIVLEGGESLLLYVNKQGTEIYAYPFAENVEVISELISSAGHPTDHVVRIHRPDRDHRGRVTFPVSWQRRDAGASTESPLWRVTRRPKSFWIEVQPLDSEREPTGQAYAFFDSTYEPEQPVPLMNLLAETWPEAATRARIKIWSQPPEEASSFELLPPAVAAGGPSVPTRLNQTIEITDALHKPVTIAPGVTLRDDPLVSQPDEELRRQRFVVEFAESDVPVTSIKLSLPEQAVAKAVRIVRQFDRQRRLSVHTFYYDASKEFPSEINVSSRSHEIQDAWQLEKEFIDVAIPYSGGLLPVGSVSRN